MSRAKAVGLHVFAGGFTVGVQRVMDVEAQLEKHGFGIETAEAMCKIPIVNEPGGNWPRIKADFCYGNPRCTGFSTITAGYGDDCHGPWSKQCQDIHDLCNYAVGKYDAIIWESVQQAYSTGRPLLDYLRDEIFKPKHYRIAHVLLNAASFGNCQQRKRYFFVAYRNDRNFNIEPPLIDARMSCVYDHIWNMRNRPTNERHLFGHEEYDEDSYTRLTPDEKKCVPLLPNGFCLNRFAQWSYEDLPEHLKMLWSMRTSPMPFSMHCIYRINWLRPSPTIHSSASRFIHPTLDRPLTVGEITKIMGWPRIPVGSKPIAQIAKGVVPDAGEWLAKQVQYYLDGAWGKEDYESTYDHRIGEWVGRDTTGEIEKTFNLTSYTGWEQRKLLNHDDHEVRDEHMHYLNVDFKSRKLRRSWDTVRRMVRAHGGSMAVEGNIERYIANVESDDLCGVDVD